MRVLTYVAVLAVVYVAIVVAFESLIGFFQPQDQNTLVITTHDQDGTPHPRVVARLDSGGRLYVAANHWPRAWYRQALANPAVEVDVDGDSRPYSAVPVEGEEAERVDAEHPLGGVVRFLTGYPPRRFLHLEPR